MLLGLLGLLVLAAGGGDIVGVVVGGRIISKRIGLEANGSDYKQTDRIISKRIGI